MLVKFKIPKNIMDLKYDECFTSMTYTYNDKQYVISKEMVNQLQNNVVIDYNNVQFDLPDCWIEAMVTVDNILGIENDEHALIVVESKDGYHSEIFYKHFGWTNKYFVATYQFNRLKPIKAEDMLAKLNLLMTKDYKIAVKLTDLNTIRKYIKAIPINILHRDIFVDQKSLNESNGMVSISYDTKINTSGCIYTTYDYEVDYQALIKNRTMLRVLNQALVRPTPQKEVEKILKEVSDHKPKSESAERLEALMSIKDDPSKDIEIDLINNTVLNEHVKKQNKIFRASKSDYAGQAIKFKGMCVHHGLSNNGIAQNLIKMPRNLTFLKVRVNGWKNNRIKTKDFAFNKEGLLSAMVYRDNNTRFENSDQLTINPYIKRFIELIGAEEFVKLYDVTPNFNHLDVGILIVKRFFKKEVQLSPNITNKVQNIIPASQYAKELLESMPSGFLIFIKTRWCVNEKKLDFKIIRDIDESTAENYSNLPKEAIGSNVCLVNGDPIYFSNDYAQLDAIVNIIAQYITKIVHIYDGVYKNITE